MRLFRLLVLATAATGGVLLAPARAAAHDMNAKVEVRADSVYVLAYFEEVIPAERAKVVVTDANGAVVLTGQTDEHGVWTFPLPKPGSYILTVKSSGHVAEVPFRVDGDSETPVVYTGWRLNKTLGLAIGLLLLLGISVGSWFIRRRRGG